MSQILEINRELYDHMNPERAVLKSKPGITEETVLLISKDKKEPEWMLQKRLQALKIYQSLQIPKWGPDLSKLNLNEITYYTKVDERSHANSWDDVPEDIKKTFEKLGIPEVERKALAGAGAQYDSMNAYHSLKKEWEEKGVIFEDCDTALKKYPELVKEYFMTRCVPIGDHKFAALHASVWSGGTFIYIPKGVKVDVPLQAYFRINAGGSGQFEHTLIIADEGSEVHYVEGCSAPQYNKNNIHAGCVEIYVKKGARVRYSSIENWSKNTYNLNTKRAIVEEDGIMEWINGNLGCLTGDSKVFTNPKGPTKIMDIETGNKVYAWDEKTNSLKKTLVKAKIFSGYKKVYKLEAGGREIEASGNHPFLTLVRKKHSPSHKKGFFYREWKSLEQLKEGDVVAIAKKIPIEGKPYELPKININNKISSNNQYSKFSMNSSHLYNKDITLPKETSEEFMWLCGILLGDGHIDLRYNKINIATHEKEDYRDELCRILKRLFNYKVTEKKERYIIINSKVLCKLFEQIGFGGNAGTKQVPDWVFTLQENQILAFLAGYFDSDGHQHPNALAFTSINREILEKIRLLGMHTGFGVSRIFKHMEAREVEIMGLKSNAKDSWRIHLNGIKVKQLPVKCKSKKIKIMNIKTKRRYNTIKGWNFNSKVNDEIGFARIDKINYTGIKPTFDIEVENFHNFVSNGLIVHNSGFTMLYPCSILAGKRARTEMIGIAFAGAGQNQDTGSKVIHIAPDTSSTIVAKSISKNGGITTYRGLLKINKGAKNAKSNVQCDALMIDNISQSNTIPYIQILEDKSEIGHEATTGKISKEKIFYLMSRGLSEEEAKKMIVSGFIEPITKQLPGEYAIELNRLIEMEMEGSLG